MTSAPYIAIQAPASRGKGRFGALASDRLRFCPGAKGAF